MGCRGEREGGLIVLPSASTQQRERGEERREMWGLPAQHSRRRRRWRRVFPMSVCKSTRSQSAYVT